MVEIIIWCSVVVKVGIGYYRMQTRITDSNLDSKVYIWNKESSTLLEALEGHGRGCVNAVSWNPADVAMFASGGDDGKVRM